MDIINMNNFINEYTCIILEQNQHTKYDDLISYFSNINNFKKLIKEKKENNNMALEHLKLFETNKTSAIKSALEWKKLEKDNNIKFLFSAEQLSYNNAIFYWYHSDSGKIDNERRNYEGKTAAIANKMFANNEPIEKIYNTIIKYGSWL